LHTFNVGTSHGWPWTHLTHHGPDSREATTFPHIVFSTTLRRTCIQMAFFSWDSQSGVPKLSRFGLPGLWAFITSRPKLGSGRGLNQSCSFPRELSNGVSHFTCTHHNQVDSWLLVVGSQTVNLIPGPSFDHNLCCRCPNGSCEAILDIYTSRPFQRYKECLNGMCFDPYHCALSFRESPRTPKSHFRECEWRPHTSLKLGLRKKHHEKSWLNFLNPNFFLATFIRIFYLNIKRLWIQISQSILVLLTLPHESYHFKLWLFNTYMLYYILIISLKKISINSFNCE